MARVVAYAWDKVFDAVEHVVTWGLEHRTLGKIDAIGVDEIQYSKGHKYLTLVYQIDLGVTLWDAKILSDFNLTEMLGTYLFGFPCLGNPRNQSGWEKNTSQPELTVRHPDYLC